jgi:hypothetical protein
MRSLCSLSRLTPVQLLHSMVSTLRWCCAGQLAQLSFLVIADAVLPLPTALAWAWNWMILWRVVSMSPSAARWSLLLDHWFHCIIIADLPGSAPMGSWRLTNTLRCWPHHLRMEHNQFVNILLSSMCILVDWRATELGLPFYRLLC